MSNTQQLETNVVDHHCQFSESEIEHRLVTIQDEINLDKAAQDIEDYMNNNSGVGKTELEKDNLYAFS
jgi:hypothetical protein